MPAHDPITIAIVRDIHQRGYYSVIENAVLREDGWVFDTRNHSWFSPSNVISISNFTPRKWDGNGLEPGALCEMRVWRGVTSVCPTGYITDLVTIISRNASAKSYTVLSSDGRRVKVGERRLVPVMTTSSST